ncbi:MAG: T9SS-dependent M36 family metallopeptidase [Thermaurantimonas sp.]|uniref:T9SS-dependent M36 family metallopeptidase n=1 Tax=Thermaurantimonas sp. TaxID=2681568 RepID=UPI00391C4489
MKMTIRFLSLIVTTCFGLIINAQNNVPNASTVRDFLINQKIHTEKDLEELRISSYHSDAKTGLTYVYWEQMYQGIPIFNGVISTAYTKDGKIRVANSNAVTNLSKKVKRIHSHLIAPEAALRAALDHLGIDKPAPSILSRQEKNLVIEFDNQGISQEKLLAEKYWLDAVDQLIPVWNIVIQPSGSSDWWNIRINAINGKFIEKNNWTAECQTTETSDRILSFGFQNIKPVLKSSPKKGALTGATYNVFGLPYESPNHGPRTLITDPHDSMASPYGWHTRNTTNLKEFTITRGNNVHAYEDQANANTPGFSPNGGDSLYFDFPVNFTAPAIQSMPAAVTNLFYMNNIAHDVFYQYGFTEAAGNFQVNNYGRGGIGNDDVRAEAMDGGGTSNANFSTPPDGQRPRMQMYLWPQTSQSSSGLRVDSPVVANYPLVPASIGPQLSTNPVSGQLVLMNDGSADPTLGCQNTQQNLQGKIVLIDRGTCTFANKILNAQQAGAIGVIVANNVSGNPIAMGGTGTGINIPSGMTTQGAGNILKQLLTQYPAVYVSLRDSSISFDSSFDNGVVLHEYGHGISTRLTGGASNSNCLSNQEQAGEGWSDLFGLFFTTTSSNTSTQRRGISTFLIGQNTNGQGIRQAPYSTSTSQNNLTYDNIKTASIPHGIGTVWATMVWEMFWNLVDIHGFDNDLYYGNGGNNIAFRLVMEGLKLQKCNPGFVDSRDAILQADTLLYNGQNSCAIWAAFAKRGLGFSANQGQATSRSDGTQAFDTHPNCLVSVSENTPSKPQPALYPNPAKDFIFIDLPEFEGRIKVRMIDLTGKLVLDDQIDLQAGNRIFVPLHQYPVGIYVLEVSDAFGHQWHSKVTIRR